MSNHLLQHSDDLDFVQDVLKASGGSRELNPILNLVLVGFGRRRRYGRFKCGQLNLQFDQLRFADTKTPKDDDRKAKDIGEKSYSEDSRFEQPAEYMQILAITRRELRNEGTKVDDSIKSNWHFKMMSTRVGASGRPSL